MAEARDRLVRPNDIVANFARRRSNILRILEDEPVSDPSTFRSPVGRGIFATMSTGAGRGRTAYRSHVTVGRENLTPFGSARRGRGRAATNSVLPYWYPRTPLRNITGVVRAIERRRSRCGEVEGQSIETPLHHGQRVLNNYMLSPLGAQHEHKMSTMSSTPKSITKSYPPVGSLPKILLDITNKIDNGSESLTPQKKLLNSIDSVEKIVMEELQRLKRTPSAKRAERERKLCTLKSMR